MIFPSVVFTKSPPLARESRKVTGDPCAGPGPGGRGRAFIYNELFANIREGGQS